MTFKVMLRVFLLLFGLMPAILLAAEPGIPAIQITPGPNGSQNLTVTMQILLAMTALTFLPAFVMMMTSFTRIIIVFSILRQALGLQQAPSNQVMIGLALFLTFFIMSPVFDQINANAVQPYLSEKMDARTAIDEAGKPLHKFMIEQTRQADLAMFMHLAGKEKVDSPAMVPFNVLVPAFVTSELKTAFQIGFMIFIPFLVIDLVVASVLMAMGMMMLSPVIVSLPFKLMLFVLVDGWSMIMGTLAASYGM
ncbi:flagellar type III secretion system pore protein FliP [Pokkaliibacter plantistimulans]|nr:flagellar type III secretion system pore protein FliP [Pokkaliibacter plantistimulans]